MGYRVIGFKETAKRLNISLSKLHEMVCRTHPRFCASFPKRVRVGARSVGFIEHEIDAWLLAQQEQ